MVTGVSKTDSGVPFQEPRDADSGSMGVLASLLVYEPQYDSLSPANGSARHCGNQIRKEQHNSISRTYNQEENG